MENREPKVTNTGGYWTASFRRNKKKHTWSFGRVDKVSKTQAILELKRRLQPETTSKAMHESNSGTVQEVVQVYVEWAEDVYKRADGTQTREAENLMYGLQPLVTLFGKMPAGMLRPRHVRDFCAQQVDAGVSRQTIVKRIGYIKRFLRWAKNNDMTPPMFAPGEKLPLVAFDACRDFEMPRKGRPIEVGGKVPREARPITTVADTTVEQTLAMLPRTVVTMAALQRLSSMRPEEVCSMTMAQIDRSQTPWLYQPVQHKTLHRGKSRRIYLGPQARELLKPYVFIDRNRPIFRPVDAAAEAKAAGLKSRFSRAEAFTTKTYRWAIWQACDKAFPAPADVRGAVVELMVWSHKAKEGEKPDRALVKRARAERAWRCKIRWSPNQLRHNGLTQIIEKEMVKIRERAKVVAGHGDQKTTQIYLDDSDMLAASVMEDAG